MPEDAIPRRGLPPLDEQPPERSPFARPRAKTPADAEPATPAGPGPDDPSTHSARSGNVQPEAASVADDPSTHADGSENVQAEETPAEPVDTAAEEPAPQESGPAKASGAKSLWHAMWHPGRGQFVIALVLALVAMGVVMQFKAKNADQSYSTARRADLIEMIDGLNSESRRLESELAELENTKRNLQSGQDSERIAQQEAERRLEVLSVLAGTAPAQGPGIRITINDPQHKVSSAIILDAVEEMRDAGAEAIEFNDSARVVATSWFGGKVGGLLIDGKPVSTPLTIDVIGDPHSLEEAARFRGGLASEVTGPNVGGTIDIKRVDNVSVTSLHAAPSQDFAKPVR